jgi:hypothetical protein
MNLAGALVGVRPTGFWMVGVVSGNLHMEFDGHDYPDFELFCVGGHCRWWWAENKNREGK